MGELDKHLAIPVVGKSVNSFSRITRRRFQRRTASRHSAADRAYAEDYRSPAQRSRRLGQPQSLGAVVRSTLQAEGTHDGDRDYLVVNLRNIWAESSRSMTSCKINLIEQAIPDDSAVLDSQILLDGKDRDGRLVSGSFFYRWHLRQCALPDGAKDWRIVTDTRRGRTRRRPRRCICSPRSTVDRHRLRA